jgi:undecaprenyl-diphosphatase
MTATLLQLVTSYGYVGVALLVTLEGIGLPVPGETALITAAALAAQGHLSIVGVLLAASLGTILGGSGGYWIGREGGLALTGRAGRWLRVNPRRLDRARGYFDRYGAKVVFLGRFVAVLRIVVALVAGVVRMPFGLFTVYNALGGICWSLIFGSAGFFLGRNLPRLEGGLGRAGFVLALLVAVIALVVLCWRWAHEHRDALWDAAARFQRRMFAARPIARLAAGRRHARETVPSARRVTPGGYLTLHVAIGFALSLVALALFATLTEGVLLERGTLAHFDAALLATLHQTAIPAAVAVANVVSLLGSVPVMSALGIAVAVVLAMRRRRLLLAGWAVALMGSALLTSLLKVLVHRPPPRLVFANPLMTANATWSFPSGHVLGALVAYGLVAYLLTRTIASHRWQVAVVAAALAVIIAIGLARLYLGVHYFSDVMAGYAAGAVWLATVISGLEVPRRHASEVEYRRVEHVSPAVGRP